MSLDSMEDEVRFDYHRPASIAEAVTLLTDSGSTGRPIGYGSDLLVWTKEQVHQPEAVIDLSGIEVLSIIEPTKDGLRVGACVSLGALGRHEIVQDRFPALAQAVGVMGSVQLREGASIGGNVCTASPAGDSGPPLLCYDATMIVVGRKGERRIPAQDFYIAPRRSALSDDEILVAIEIPNPPDGAVGAYLKGARRAAVDLAVVSVGAVAWRDSSTASGFSLRMALGAVAPTPIRAPQAEAWVTERGLARRSDESAKRALADAARESARPIDDVRASAAYRSILVGELAAKASAQLADALA